MLFVSHFMMTTPIGGWGQCVNLPHTITQQHSSLGKSSMHTPRRPPAPSPAPLLPSRCPRPPARSSGAASEDSQEPGLLVSSAQRCLLLLRRHLCSIQEDVQWLLSNTIKLSQRHFSTKSEKSWGTPFTSQFSHRQNGNNDGSQVTEQLWGLQDLIHVKHLEEAHLALNTQSSYCNNWMNKEMNEWVSATWVCANALEVKILHPDLITEITEVKNSPLLCRHFQNFMFVFCLWNTFFFCSGLHFVIWRGKIFSASAYVVGDGKMEAGQRNWSLFKALWVPSGARCPRPRRKDHAQRWQILDRRSVSRDRRRDV